MATYLIYYRVLANDDAAYIHGNITAELTAAVRTAEGVEAVRQIIIEDFKQKATELKNKPLIANIINLDKL